jgi:hypothetical protein
MAKLWKSVPALLVACAAALSLTVAAGGAISPVFSAGTDGNGTTISYSQGGSDDALALLRVYVPAGYNPNLADPTGTAVGKATGTLDGASASGSVVVGATDTALTYGGASTTLGAVATGCTGTATHTGYWIASLGSAQVPVFVDDISVNDPISTYFTDVITVCLAPTGPKLSQLSLALTNLSVPDGWYMWHATATPYVAGKAAATPSVEAESLDRTPQELTLNGVPARAPGTATVSGRLKVGGKGFSGATVKILAGKRVVATAKTGPGGRFKTAVKLAGKSAKLTASADAAAATTTCQGGLFAPATCASATRAAFSIVSEPTTVHTK